MKNLILIDNHGLYYPSIKKIFYENGFVVSPVNDGIAVSVNGIVGGEKGDWISLDINLYDNKLNEFLSQLSRRTKKSILHIIGGGSVYEIRLYKANGEMCFTKFNDTDSVEKDNINYYDWYGIIKKKRKVKFDDFIKRFLFKYKDKEKSLQALGDIFFIDNSLLFDKKEGVDSTTWWFIEKNTNKYKLIHNTIDKIMDNIYKPVADSLGFKQYRKNLFLKIINDVVLVFGVRTTARGRSHNTEFGIYSIYSNGVYKDIIENKMGLQSAMCYAFYRHFGNHPGRVYFDEKIGEYITETQYNLMKEYLLDVFNKTQLPFFCNVENIKSAITSFSESKKMYWENTISINNKEVYEPEYTLLLLTDKQYDRALDYIKTANYYHLLGKCDECVDKKCTIECLLVNNKIQLINDILHGNKEKNLKKLSMYISK